MLHAPVAPAVIAAARDLVAARVGAHGAHGRVGRVRARLDEDRLLAAGHDVGEPLLQFVLQRLHEAETEAFVHLRLGGVVDLVLDVAEDDRPVGAEHVDVLVAVHVDDVPAVAMADEHRVLADHEVVGPADAADAARREPLGIVEHGHRLEQVELRCAFHRLGHGGSFQRFSREGSMRHGPGAGRPRAAAHASLFRSVSDTVPLGTLPAGRPLKGAGSSDVAPPSSCSPSSTTSSPAATIRAPPMTVHTEIACPRSTNAYRGAEPARGSRGSSCAAP